VAEEVWSLIVDMDMRTQCFTDMPPFHFEHRAWTSQEKAAQKDVESDGL